MQSKQVMPKLRRKDTLKQVDRQITADVSTIDDLIQLGKSDCRYRNINMNMLKNILPHLCELNNLVGMNSLKESVFFQIIYYLQGLNKNHNEEYLHTIIMGTPGCGKCLSKNTPILMYDGSIKLVQNIAIGDILMGDDSQPRTVLSTCSGRDKLYTVCQQYGESYKVNGEHMLSLQSVQNINVVAENDRVCRLEWCDKNGKRTKTVLKEHMPASLVVNDVIDISVKDYLSMNAEWRACFKGFKTSVNFEYVEVCVDPYFVGFWLGDSTNENLKLRTNKDVNIYFIRYVRNMRSYVKYNMNDILSVKDFTENREFQLYNALKKYDLINSKRIPLCYKANSKEYRLKVLAGFLDSAIHILTYDSQYDERYVKIAIRWYELAEDVVFLCRSLGFFCDIEIIPVEALRKNCNRHDHYYCVRILGNFEQIPCKQMLKNFADVQNNELLTYDIDIRENEEEEEYYGFELTSNGRFLLEDFTVTHNTTVARILGKIYTSLGILSEDSTFRIAYRDDFIGEYLGHTAIKTRKLLESCIGGVLFIDEVYALAPRDKSRDSFSKEALDTLTAFLSEHKNDFCCIAAGYEKDIQECFFSMNSGLARRFPWIHRIDDYSDDNLASILVSMIQSMSWDICVEKDTIVSLIKNNKDLFVHHGGSVEVYLSKCKMAHAKRIFGLDEDHKFVIVEKDLISGMKMLRATTNVKEKDPFALPPPLMYT